MANLASLRIMLADSLSFTGSRCSQRLSREGIWTRLAFYYVSPGMTRKLSGQSLLNPWQCDRENDPIDHWSVEVQAMRSVLAISGSIISPLRSIFLLSILADFFPAQEVRHDWLGFLRHGLR